MPSLKFERVKAQHRNLAELLDRMVAYVRQRTDAGATYVTPRLAAAALKISEGEAFVLLRILAEGGVLKQQYNVYCRKEDIFLQHVDSLDDLDKVKGCDFCDRSHDPREFYVEIAFRPAEGTGASDFSV